MLDCSGQGETIKRTAGRLGITLDFKGHALGRPFRANLGHGFPRAESLGYSLKPFHGKIRNPESSLLTLSLHDVAPPRDLSLLTERESLRLP
jgi:hypothetical protein